MQTSRGKEMNRLNSIERMLFNWFVGGLLVLTGLVIALTAAYWYIWEKMV